MADDRTLPFEERAYENYREEMEEMEKIAVELETREPSEIDDYREPLSLDERREITVLLSWGGPLMATRYISTGIMSLWRPITFLLTGLNIKSSN